MKKDHPPSRDFQEDLGSLKSTITRPQGDDATVVALQDFKPVSSYNLLDDTPSPAILVPGRSPSPLLRSVIDVFAYYHPFLLPTRR